jgi:hypothetical protein
VSVEGKFLLRLKAMEDKLRGAIGDELFDYLEPMTWKLEKTP